MKIAALCLLGLSGTIPSVAILPSSITFFSAETENQSGSIHATENLHDRFIGKSIKSMQACLNEGSVCYADHKSQGTCCAGLTCAPQGAYGSLCEKPIK